MEGTEARQQIFLEAAVQRLGVTGPTVPLGLDPFAGHRCECWDLRAVQIFSARDLTDVWARCFSAALLVGKYSRLRGPLVPIGR